MTSLAMHESSLAMHESLPAMHESSLAMHDSFLLRCMTPFPGCINLFPAMHESSLDASLILNEDNASLSNIELRGTVRFEEQGRFSHEISPAGRFLKLPHATGLLLVRVFLDRDLDLGRDKVLGFDFTVVRVFCWRRRTRVWGWGIALYYCRDVWNGFGSFGVAVKNWKWAKINCY
uniref:Uncharacterized protein n=1 Tax=Solanum tuberosum TaxID=4113 RepID=M1DZ19_SOLTU